jgi:hypothetical protein
MKSPIVAAVLIFGSITSSFAQSPVAIVEDVKGKVTGAEFMDYVVPGTVIKLGAEGTVVLGYMSSCVRETIKGGVAIVGTDESRTSLGEVTRETVACDSKRAQLSPHEATQSAATTFRSLDPSKQASAATTATATAKPVIYGLSPVIEMAKPGKVVIERIDLPGERFEANVSAKMLVKGKFYDLAVAGKSLAAGGTYAAIAGSQRAEFKVDPAARPGASPIVGRLVRL